MSEKMNRDVSHAVSISRNRLMIFPRFSAFLPQYKDMHVRLTGQSKLAVGVNISIVFLFTFAL